MRDLGDLRQFLSAAEPSQQPQEESYAKIVFFCPQLALRLQRKYELEADEIAVRTIGGPTAMIRALRKLADLNLVPAETKSGVHPSMVQRIQRIEQLTTG